MSEPIQHRGPDDSGIWVDERNGLAFGFRRLAIIDLSHQGHQPMHSATGRFTIMFNGEVYNHPVLRRELEDLGSRFQSRSDTEVLLAAFEQWGLRKAVERFDGMFSISLWDSHTHQLHLIRDRLGIKPLFLYWRPGILTFASELKAIVAGPGFNAALDMDALAAYFRGIDAVAQLQAV